MMDGVQSPIVGRDAVLDELAETLGLDGSTPGRAVLLGGDAGIGKTRVVDETVERARAAGVRVLVGHCLDLGEHVPAFQPVADALAGLDATPSADDVVGLGELATSLPALEVLRSGGVGEDDGDRLRADVVAAVAHTLEHLAAAGPVLLVLEDLHWADASTRHLVRYLLGRRFVRPVGLVLSFRSDDLHRRHPLRPALAEWTRLPSVQRIDLAPLDDAAMSDLLRGRTSRDLSTDGVDTILARAEGNAFYAEELLDAGLAGGSLPENLADLLLVRVDRLHDDARAVVRAVACAGGPVADALLRRAVETEGPVDDALREAVDLKVLVPVGEALRFRHALLAEAVLDDLLPGERRRVHAAFLRALESDPGPVAAATVALHAHGAGDPALAFEADLRAADEARRVGGHDEAAGHLQRALGVVDHAPEGHDVVGLVTLTADTLLASGRLRTAGALLADHLEHEPRGEGRARLLYTQGQITYLGGTDAEADAASRAALAAAEDASVAVRARVESLRAQVASTLGLLEESVERAETALRLAEEAGDDQTVAEAQTTLLRVLARTGADAAGTREGYLELAEAARARGDVHGELRAWHHLAFSHFNAGELERADHYFRVCLARGRATGRSWAPYGFDGRFFAALVAYLRGDWEEVAVLAQDLRGATRLARACLQAVGMLVAAGRGTPLPADVVTSVRARWDLDLALAVHSGTALVDAAADAHGAIQAHDELVTTLDAVWRDHLGPQRLRLGGLLVGRLAGAAPTSGAADRRRVLEAADAALAAAEEAAALAPQLGPEGRAWLVRLQAERLRLRWLAGVDADRESLEAFWRRAVEGFGAYGEVYERARSQVRLAQVLLASGRREEAVSLVEDATATAHRLGAQPLLDEAAALVPLRPDVRAEAQAVALTPREREVLSLVAEGRTNGEVAARLFISTKTASVHVSHILAKLGASSRTEAAAVARRDGLL